MLVHGDMWWNPAAGSSQCFFPSTTSHNIGFAGALWMSGYDAMGGLHLAAQTYRQTGNNYWPGPLDASDTLTYATSTDWNKIWKVTRVQINAFRDSATHTTTNTPAPILQWPGKGNTYAQGYAGAALTITNDMAPFVDLNGNGIYEPLLGEYPDVKGDEALWLVFSDNGPAHNDTLGRPLGVEIHAMAYGYSRGTLIDNVIFYEYTIVNRSSNSYTNFRIGQFADMDLGYYLDDFIGFDSVHRMGIVYNGAPYDSVYGSNIPMAGVTMIILPGDTGTSFVPAGSFTYYNNDLSVIGNPVDSTQYNYYLRSKILSGQHVTDDFTVAGTPTTGYGTGPNTNYVYPGDPSDSTQWSECSSGNTPGDRRFIITSNDFTLAAGGTQRVVMALVAIDPGPNACGDAGLRFDSIKTLADTAWNIFFNPLPANSVKNIATGNTVNIYPNPAHDLLYVDISSNAMDEPYITIYNSIGQIMNVPISHNGQKYEANISKLPPGLYNILYRDRQTHVSKQFIKE